MFFKRKLGIDRLRKMPSTIWATYIWQSFNIINYINGVVPAFEPTMRIPDSVTADYHNFHLTLEIESTGWHSGSILAYDSGRLVFDSL